MDVLRSADPEVASIVDCERDRQLHTIELIASENFTSAAVMRAVGSVLTNKYAEGYPGKRYYGGCELRRSGRDAGDRAGEEAVRRRARQRSAAFRRSGEHGRHVLDTRSRRHAFWA